jgi:hypothetical protein
MKRFSAALLSLAISVSAPALAGVDNTLVWDNFPVTEGFPNGYDASNRFTSERNTQHSSSLNSASWAVDDFHIVGAPKLGEGEEIVLSEIEWVGVRQLFDRPGFGYDRLDYAIFSRMFDPQSGEFDFEPISYGNGQTALFLDQQVGEDWQIEEELGTVSANEFVFRGSVQVPNIPLDFGMDYWVGVRLVGNDANDDGGTAGRHLIVSASGHPESVDTAFRFDPPRGGAPWQYIENPLNGQRFEAAYRLTMTVIPEPATLMLLALSGMFAARRRGKR